MTRHVLTLSLLAGLAIPAAAPAQETDGRWLAWMGCWEPVGEAVTAPGAEADAREAMPEAGIPERMIEAGDPEAEPTPGALRCFEPATEDIGVRMVSIDGAEVVATETLRADGIRRDATREGCTGWEAAEFASRPGVVFVSSEHACEGGVTRTSTGMFALLSMNEWVDVRVMTAGEGRTTWVTRYRMADPAGTEAAGFADVAGGRDMSVRSIRVAASAGPSVDDVIEASRHVDAEAVSAWLAERGVRLDIDSDELVRMADAGVPEEVIDMAIAVSFPSRFAVDRGDDRYGRRGDRYGYGYPAWGYYDPFYGPFFYSPFGYGYGRYGYYGRLGYYRPIVIRPETDSGGRVINGQGYRRGTGSSGVRSGLPTSRGSAVGSPRGSSGGRSTGRTAKRRGGSGGGG